MATEVKRRRGTRAQHATFTGAAGEFTYDTDRKTLVAHDGATQGGFAMERAPYPSVAALVASSETARGEGERWRAEGYVYGEKSSGTSDITTSGGVKLDVQGANNVYPALAYDPAADGVTDDAAKIGRMNVSGRTVDLGGKDYAYSGVFSAVATFVNGRVIDDNRTYDFRVKTHETASTAGQHRGRINYNTGSSVRVDGLPDKIVMGGFRSFGQYLKGTGRVVPTGLGSASYKVVTASDVAGLTGADDNNWYAVFAVATDDEDECRFVWVPYFRCYSVAGNVVTLGAGQENQNVTPATKTYSMADDAFNGVDCLVITEGGMVSRRVTTITDSDSTTITLADATGVAQLDFLLPAPPGADSYHYLGTFLYEPTNSVRNIADSGSTVQARMVNANEVTAAGAASNAKIRLGGNISPLAVGYIGSMNQSLSTGSTGNASESLSHDSSTHDVWRCNFYKDGTGAFSANAMAEVMFSKEQALWHTSGGSLSGAVVARTMLTYGWIEP